MVVTFDPVSAYSGCLYMDEFVEGWEIARPSSFLKLLIWLGLELVARQGYFVER